MKSLLLLTMGFVLILNTISFSQVKSVENGNSGSLDRIISIDLRNVSFERALDVLSEKSSTKFNYIKDNLPLEQTITLNMDSVTVREALMKILNDTETGLKVTKDGLAVILPAKGVQGEISGKVTDKATGESLIGANIVITGTFLGASTDNEGRFRILKLSPGEYSLEASYIGYKSEIVREISLSNEDSREVNFELSTKIASLEEIVVTPGHYSLMEDRSISVNSLEADDMKSFPQLGEDIYRAVKRLPGLSGNDFSAKFAIRGGEQEEVLVLLDGMELYEPFHLKDVGGATSIIDVEAVNGIDMMTGAFPAEYGNRLSGVFNMKTGTRKLEKPRVSTALSLMNARFITEGNYAYGKGYWQVVGRRGYIDLVLRLLDEAENFKPIYYDLLMKTQYFLNESNSISAHLLASDDELTDYNEEAGESLRSSYGNSYAWLKWDSQVKSGLFAQTLLSYGNVNQKRFADDSTGSKKYFEATNNKGFDFYGLKQDWTFDLTENSF